MGLSIPTMTHPPLPPTLKERETTYFFEPRKFHHHYQGCLDSSQFASVSRSRWIRTQAFSRDYRPLLGGAPIGGSPVTYMGGVLVYGLTWWERKGVRLPPMSGFAKSQKTCTNCGDYRSWNPSVHHHGEHELHSTSYINLRILWRYWHLTEFKEHEVSRKLWLTQIGLDKSNVFITKRVVGS